MSTWPVRQVPRLLASAGPFWPRSAGHVTVGFVPCGSSPQQEVTEAARWRAAALAAQDEAELRVLMHPDLQWTSFRGEVLDYEAYIAGNIRGDMQWRSQRLEGIRAAVAGDTAVLTAAVSDEVSRGGRDQSFRLLLTLTWVRLDPVRMFTRGAWPWQPAASAIPRNLTHADSGIY